LNAFSKIKRFSEIFLKTLRHLNVAKRLERRGEFPRSVLQTQIARWAGEMMVILKMEVSATGTPERNTPVIFVGNHLSYLDIPVLLLLAPGAFIAKKQLERWPVIGPAAKRIDTLLVDRTNKNSRQNIAESIAPFIREKKQSVFIFPSGTTRLTEDKPWRWGAFRIAHENNIPIQPFRIRYSPDVERAAFLDEDFFAIHLWKFLNGPTLRATVEFLPPTRVTDPAADAEKWWRWSREGMAEHLPPNDLTTCPDYHLPK
jgi:1-acyl-sn-glycerol-3-phosphate acyltransferase